LPVPAEFARLRIVLVDVRNPLNIGAAARAMSNFGFSQSAVVNPYDVAFGMLVPQWAPPPPGHRGSV